MNDITALGEILIDFTFDGLKENGTPLFAQHPGGAPGNVCVGVQRLGGKSAFAGKIGQDMHGRFLQDVLEREGVDTTSLVSDPDVFTTLAFVNVTPDGEREFSFARKPGADTQIRFEEIHPETITDSKIFHVGSLSLTDEPAKTTTLQALAAARRAGVQISYDPNYRASLWKDQQSAVAAMRSLIPQADIMKISDEETALLTDYADPEQAARSLIEQGVKVAAVTLGSKGALVCSRQGCRTVPGFKSRVADTNGAGDSFWAAMLYQIAASGKKAEDLSLDELADMARFANAAAALTVRKHGAIPALPTGQEVEAFLQQQDH